MEKSIDHDIDNVRKGHPKIGWSIVAVCISLITIAIIYFAPKMSPVKEGDAYLFWQIATHVVFDQDRDYYHGTAYTPDGDIWAYEVQHMHGSNLYWVSREDVLTKIDEVVAKMLETIDNEDFRPYVRKAFILWQAKQSDGKKDAQALVTEIKEQLQINRIEDDDTGSCSCGWADRNEELFNERWYRANWYWATFAFEIFFFYSLIVFAFSPIIYGEKLYKAAFKWSLLPLLFMAPVYLGYASYSFTTAGPAGGIVYPYMLVLLHGGYCNQVDLWLFQMIPLILEPISTPIGSPMALSGKGVPGPTSTVLAGIIIYASVYVFKFLFSQRHRFKRTMGY